MLVPKIIETKKNSEEAADSKREFPSRGRGVGRWGGKPPPGLGGFGGLEVQKERRFGGSGKGGSERGGTGRTSGALHADPMGRRILCFMSFSN